MVNRDSVRWGVKPAVVLRLLQTMAMAFAVSVAGASAAAPEKSGAIQAQTQAQAASADLRPRLYIQIRSEAQRPAAEAFRKKITGVMLGGRAVIGMASDVVENSGVQATELRCMTKADCSQAQALAAAVGKALGTPPPPVKDFSVRYEGKTSARPLHYEIWFGPEWGAPAAVVALAPVPPVAAKSAEPRITKLLLGSVKPEALRDGQAAIAEFQVTLGAADQVAGATPEFLKSRLYLAIDGARATFDRVVIASVSSAPESSVIVSATFRPSLPLSPRALVEGSRSVEAAVGDTANAGLLSPPVLVTIDTWSGTPTLLAGSLAFVVLVVAGLRFDLIGSLERLLRTRATRVFEASRTAEASSGSAAPEPRARRPAPIPPPELLAAVAQQSAVLVLGGDASALAGAPTLAGFARRMIERGGSKIPPSLVRLAADSPESIGPTAMDALLAAVPREDLLAEAPKYFDRPVETGLHHQLLAPAWRGVIALTFDRLVEQTLARRKREEPWAIWTLEDGAEMAEGLRAPKPFLIRPYGALDRPASMLFSPDEMQRQMYRASEAQRALSFLLQHNTFVFIGVPPTELQALLTAIAPHAAPEAKHFALLPDDPANDVLELSLEKFGVRVLSFDPSAANAAVVEFATAVIRQSANAPAGSAGAGAANQLQSVRLSNVGIFRSLELEFGNGPDAGGADWTVLFGGNGVGKSTVLRSIGLVLAGDDPSAIPVGRRLLRSGADMGSIEVRMGDITYVTELRRDRTDVRVRSGQLSPVQAGAALVLGFPALRGAPTSNPRGPTKQRRVGPQAADVVPLVTGAVDDRLGSFKQWLVNVLVESRDGSPQALAMKGLLETLLRDMVPGDIEAFAPIQGPDYEIRLHSRDGEVPFDNLSQGMVSIFNWLGVLVQRLYDVYPDARPPEHEAALLLIDEIDSHLHPDWQRRLVELTKRHFPKVQMVATSHSALLAGALRKGELCVFERGDDDEIVVRRELDYFGKRTQDILQSPVFGLTSDRAPGAERDIKAYFAAFEKVEANRTPEDVAVIKALGPRLEAIGYGRRPTDPLAALTPTDVDALKGLLGDGTGETR